MSELLPDFSAQFTDGRQFHRRDLKGRQHAVIYFMPHGSVESGLIVLHMFAVQEATWRAARAAILVVLPTATTPIPSGLHVAPVLDRDGGLRARFGVGRQGALFVVDRYGEIVLRIDDAEPLAAAPPAGSPHEQILPTLELLEVRCTL